MDSNMGVKLSVNLQKIMKDNRVNLMELSKAVDIPNSTIHGWLNGANPRNIGELKRVADYFQISIDKLCFNDMSVETPEKIIASHGGVELIMRTIKKENK